MNKILVLIKNNNIIFSLYNKPLSDSNLNNTNVIDTKNFKFSDEYILNNLDLIVSFLNLVVLKSEINTAIIKNNEIAETILILLKNIEKIDKVIFSENKEINYTISSLLIENNHLNNIECYSLPNIMFHRFPKNMLKTRCKILFTSDFMNYNNINTYSDLCNKEKIVIDSYLTKYDVDDIIYFFKENDNLKKIVLIGYNKSNLLAFLDMIKQNNHKNITIFIYEDSNTSNDIISDMPLFNKLKKKYKVNIKIKYSKQYKEKNYVKELNIVFIRNIFLILILVVILIIFLLKLKERNDYNKINVNLKVIDEIVEQTKDKLTNEDTVVEDNKIDTTEEENEYISPYYINYELVYNELLKINEDTIGWIKVKNTNINYPIVQTNNNDYYLNHAFDKTENIAGWIFADYRNNMDTISKNTIIYGHSVRGRNLMFGSLKNVLNENWYTNPENLKIELNIKGTTYNWQIFSIYTTKVTNDYLVSDFNSESSFINYISMVKNRSIKDFGINIGNDDKILTLSTCYNDSNYRLVVHAKMIK